MGLNPIDGLTVHDYLEKLSSPDFPGPASGSAAATVAAMAAALLEMSCNVSIRKGVENIPLSLKHIEDVRNQCLAIATEDMKALTEVVKAAKSKANFPDEYETAMKNATNTLVSVLKNGEIILNGIEQLFHLSNKRVLGELAGSANMAEAAVSSAKYGKVVNLSYIHDPFYKESIWAIVRESYQNSSEMKQRIDRLCGK
jgi:formiminotetrahydrofolate cyclodeaminase